MARAQYDREQVIRNSTQLFWQRGFYGSSMQQVIKATGLKPGSLYLAFGNKEGLYQAALEYYAGRSREVVRQVLDDAPSVGAGICRILVGMVEESAQAEYCSCFLVKSQLELAATGGELYQCVSKQLREIEALYAEYLGREYGEEQAAVYGASVMIHIFGVRVYGYLGHPREKMLDGVRSGLGWLPWGESGG